MALIRTFCLFTLLLCVPAFGAPDKPAPAAPQTPVTQAIAKAEKLFQAQNWADARTAYDKARELQGDWSSPEARLAVEGAVACSMRLSLWDDALTRSQNFVDQNKGRFEEAVGARFLAGIYLSVPHYGTKQGGVFHRGQYGQGVQVTSFKKDRKDAIRLYEEARDVLAGLVKNIGATPDNPNTPERLKLLNGEQIGLDFDLVAVLSAHDYEEGYGFGWFGWWWSDEEPEEDSDAVDEADYEQPRWYGRYPSQVEKPTGLPLGPDGQPQFMVLPATYVPEMGDGFKIRFILDEIKHLDVSDTKDSFAQALMRQAMICRSLYGPDVVAQWNNIGTQYDRFGHPLPKAPDANPPAKKLWELGDDEALAIAGGKLQVVTLPAAESPLALLSQIETACPKSSLVPEAIYTRALYYQNRQEFPQALAEYQRLIATFPKAPRCKDAKSQIALIHKPGVLLDPTGVHLPGKDPVVTFTYRNAGEVTFAARRFDMAAYVSDSFEGLTRKNNWNYTDFGSQFFDDYVWVKYSGKPFTEWKEEVTLNEANRADVGKTSVPLTEPGAYIIEARVKGVPEASRVLVLITDIAIVHKNLVDKGLIYVADAQTGQPIANHKVRIVEIWDGYHVISTMMTTDKDGAVEYKRKKENEGSVVNAIVTDDNSRMAFSFFQNWAEADYPNWNLADGQNFYVITDRPVYRPGSTMKFRVWARNRQDGLYVNPYRETNQDSPRIVIGQDPVRATVDIYDPKGSKVQTLDLPLDESGCVSGEYKLDDKAPLGVYAIHVDDYVQQGYNRNIAGALFRVEEYKKPEFEVTVTPAKTQARLGEKVSATIKASYYFGAPVAQGQVSYKVYREDYHHVYWGPGEYDWLYGEGYGYDYYPYPWFSWWGRWGGFIIGDLWPYGYGYPYGGYGYPYGGFENGFGGDQEMMDQRSAESGTRHALRELVAQGTGQLKADGTYDVEFDTAPALRDLGDRDHRYTIEAEVRDASRRTITGQGDIKVTRQQFYAFAQTQNGWYEPQEDAFVDVRTLTADNVPVATQGKVTVYRISYDGPDQSVEKEEIVTSWDAATDVDGRLSFKYPIPSEGQYRITYLTHDDWQQEVQANTVFWVDGPKFDGRLYRFNDLEIVADKRTYLPGDTAHLLINTAENNSRILFSDDASGEILRNYRFIDLPQRSTVVDVPITAAQVPNFFVEATLVSNGHVRQESRELFVPPTKDMLNLTVTTDKAAYKPGEQGKVQVKLTDSDGKPVVGHVTLTAFDEAITYIQDEFAPAPKLFFYGQLRTHMPFVDASLEHTYSPFGVLDSPENELYINDSSMPEGWNGSWGISTTGLSLSGSINGDFMVGRYRNFGGYWSDADGLTREKTADFDGLISYGAPSAAMAGSDEMTIDGTTASLAPGGMGGGNAEGALVLDGGNAYTGSTFGAIGGVTTPSNGAFAAPGPALVDPAIRSNFADTALWLPDLKTDENGNAAATVTFPDSLTTWRFRGYGLTNTTQVGDGIGHATTTKNLIVQLEAPRFFIERDEAVLSANVHNYLATSKSVTAELTLPAAEMESLDQTDQQQDANGNVTLTATATVDPKGEHRFDWPVRILKQGTAVVTVKALTDEESDAMQLAFPVLVHGINKMVAQGGSYRVTDNGTRDLQITLPAEIDPEQTKLEVTLSPSLGGVMIDALPYLSGYPYGCVEQTMSRFYPSVLVRDTLKKMGTDLETIGKQRKQMYTAADLQHRFGDSSDMGAHDPVFDSDELNHMIRAGLRRITNFQHDDGGWGWWSDDDSSPFETAYVLQGLTAAKVAGVDIDNGSYEHGINFLQSSIQHELAKPKDKQDLGDEETQAYVAYILALTGRNNNDDQVKWLNELYDHRGDQNNYGKALLALTFKLRNQDDRATLLLQNILQFVDRDDSNETAWIRTPQDGWWFWWNNDIETNAWVLKALVAIDPKNDISPRIVKWLLNNRKNGTYWRSTRDTAQVIAAMTDYMRASGEGNPNYDLTVKLDGQTVKTVKVTKDNFFTFDNRFVLYGLQVKPGPHTVTLEKTGPGALYYSAYLSYFTKEDDIKAAGNEISIVREYYQLKPKVETVVAQPNSGSGWNWWGFGPLDTLPAGQDKPESALGHVEQRSVYDRIPLKNGDAVTSGEEIEVVLKIHSKNTYDYLAFEDMKPAGCEPVDLRSGGKFAGGLCPNVELRDEKVVFFIALLEQGDHILRYKLRAETPGTFHALPTSGYAMYAPEVRAISDEMKLKINDP